MAIKVKSASEIAAKFARVTPGRTVDYSEGVAATSPQEYQAATVAAAPSYAQGVQAAIAEKRFEKGVGRAGDKWKKKAEDTGASRYGPGVAAAAGDYEQGFAPYAATIASLTLPPRGPAGSPQNIERVRAVATALRAKKVGATK